MNTPTKPRARSRGKHPGGRPPEINETKTETIIAAVRRGAYLETAAAAAGIAKSTLYRWLTAGAREREAIDSGADPDLELAAYLRFSDAIKVALAESEIEDLETIGRAAAKEWTAAAWRLERKFPDRYGRRDRQPLETRPRPEGSPEQNGGIDGLDAETVARLLDTEDGRAALDALSTSMARIARGDR